MDMICSKLKLFGVMYYEIDILFSEDCSEDCDANANCVQEEDGDRCVCRTGYVGDGYSCLSEISDGNHSGVTQISVYKYAWVFLIEKHGIIIYKRVHLHI